MFRDGWICSACWKPNRSADDRCYVCKTPRGQVPSDQTGMAAPSIGSSTKSQGRLDTRFAFLTLLVSLPLRVTGVLSIVTGILVVALGLLSGGRGEPVLGMSPIVIFGIFAFVVVAFGALQLFVARSVQRFSRWAYAVALVLGLTASLPRLLGLVHPSAQVSGSMLTVYLGVAWVYLALAALAAFLLVASMAGGSGASEVPEADTAAAEARSPQP